MGGSISGGERLGSVKNSNDQKVTDYAGGLPVTGASLDRTRDVLEDIRDIGRELILHLREMTGDNFSGDI